VLFEKGYLHNFFGAVGRSIALTIFFTGYFLNFFGAAGPDITLTVFLPVTFRQSVVSFSFFCYYFYNFVRDKEFSDRIVRFTILSDISLSEDLRR
jgi:hypothetical protein